MKSFINKTFYVLVLLAASFFLPSAALCANDSSIAGDTRMLLLETMVHLVTENRLASSQFDIQGTVTDVNGNPLNGVELYISLSRPNTRTIVNSDREKETLTINSEFHVKKDGWTDLRLYFMKDGYYPESRSFDVDSFHKDPSKRKAQEKIQVKMIKQGPLADVFVVNQYLRYDFDKKAQTICDLTEVLNPKKNENEYEDEDEDEENSGLTKKNSAPDSQNGKRKYLELDFKRDKKGNVIYDGMWGGLPCPSTIIIRLHSEDPDDGLILINDLNPDVTHDDYVKLYTTAPEKGFGKKEIEIKMKPKGKNGDFYPIDRNLLFVFFKVEKHYGKGVFDTIRIKTHPKENKIGQVSTEIDLYINKKEDDKNLTTLY